MVSRIKGNTWGTEEDVLVFECGSSKMRKYKADEFPSAHFAHGSHN